MEPPVDVSEPNLMSVQWNLQIKDTLRPTILTFIKISEVKKLYSHTYELSKTWALSFVERLSLILSVLYQRVQFTVEPLTKDTQASKARAIFMGGPMISMLSSFGSEQQAC